MKRLIMILIIVLLLVFAPALYLGALCSIILIYFTDKREFARMVHGAVKI